jgi:heme oxygenase
MVIERAGRRQSLRHATQTAHARLDDLIERAGLLKSRAEYELYLQATWTARWPCEQALESWGAAALYAAWPQRRICDTLSQDIFDVSHIRPAEAAHGLPEVLSEAQALGILYVLEGSALGARILETQAAAIGMTASFGARHMARQTSAPGAWSQFMALLARTPMSSAGEEQCTAAALAAFALYEEAFRHLAHGQ